uniref:Lipid droplet-associated hydrolase n=1 Tax=Ditylenchus dipsaci TaxID=166011 RepID=A0A915D3D4_9BILA
MIPVIRRNSGNEGYYEQFGRELIPLIGAKHGMVYFYTVSHLNHVPMPRELARTGKSKPSDLFSLDDQIEHKKEFCREYLPKQGKLFVIGHSIGSYIALKTLSFLVENGWNLHMAYPLFPAIERLSDTPNGARLKPIAKFMNKHDKFTRFMFSWLKITPFWMKRCIVSCSLKPYGKCPECISRAGAEVLAINCMRNVAYITCIEMEQIGEFDESLIAAKEHIRFYYGTGDYWILPEFAEQMMRRLPHQVIVDKHEQHHAFCLKDNVIMAKVIAGLIECETCPVDEGENPFVTRPAGPFSFAADWFF